MIVRKREKVNVIDDCRVSLLPIYLRRVFFYNIYVIYLWMRYNINNNPNNIPTDKIGIRVDACNLEWWWTLTDLTMKSIYESNNVAILKSSFRNSLELFIEKFSIMKYRRARVVVVVVVVGRLIKIDKRFVWIDHSRERLLPFRSSPISIPQ